MPNWQLEQLSPWARALVNYIVDPQSAPREALQWLMLFPIEELRRTIAEMPVQVIEDLANHCRIGMTQGSLDSQLRPSSWPPPIPASWPPPIPANWSPSTPANWSPQIPALFPRGLPRGTRTRFNNGELVLVCEAHGVDIGPASRVDLIVAWQSRLPHQYAATRVLFCAQCFTEPVFELPAPLWAQRDFFLTGRPDCIAQGNAEATAGRLRLRIPGASVSMAKERTQSAHMAPAATNSAKSSQRTSNLPSHVEPYTTIPANMSDFAISLPVSVMPIMGSTFPHPFRFTTILRQNCRVSAQAEAENLGAVVKETEDAVRYLAAHSARLFDEGMERVLDITRYPTTQTCECQGCTCGMNIEAPKSRRERRAVARALKAMDKDQKARTDRDLQRAKGVTLPPRASDSPQQDVEVHHIADVSKSKANTAAYMNEVAEQCGPTRKVADWLTVTLPIIPENWRFRFGPGLFQSHESHDCMCFVYEYVTGKFWLPSAKMGLVAQWDPEFAFHRDRIQELFVKCLDPSFGLADPEYLKSEYCRRRQALPPEQDQSARMCNELMRRAFSRELVMLHLILQVMACGAEVSENMRKALFLLARRLPCVLSLFLFSSLRSVCTASTADKTLLSRYVEQQLQILNAARCYRDGQPWVFESRTFQSVVSWEIDGAIRRRTAEKKGAAKPTEYTLQDKGSWGPKLNSTYFAFSGLG